MAPERYAKVIAKLGLSQRAAARFLGINETTSRKMIRGDGIIGPATAMLLELMVKHDITPYDALRSIGINPEKAERKAEPRHAPTFYERRS